MLELKPLSKDSIPGAIYRAKHYRLLNEPWQAASICRDILRVEPENQEAIHNLILALSDQFGSEKKYESQAKELCKRIDGEYEQNYYKGLVSERLGKAALKRATPRAGFIAYEHYKRAMNFYEEAEKVHPDDNEDSVLRWNACARTIRDMNLEPSPNEDQVQPFLDV